jgi:hypothetical protein
VTGPVTAHGDRQGLAGIRGAATRARVLERRNPLIVGDISCWSRGLSTVGNIVIRKYAVIETEALPTWLKLVRTVGPADAGEHVA